MAKASANFYTSYPLADSILADNLNLTLYRGLVVLVKLSDNHCIHLPHPVNCHVPPGSNKKREMG